MPSADEAWYQALFSCLNYGDEIGPRGIKTYELLGKQVEWDMNKPVVGHPLRKLNYRFMAAEAYWITSGSPLVEEIVPYCKHMEKYSDDGYIFNGAYGPMIESQTNFVVNTLINDIDSRQAVLTIWTPNPSKSKDHRCTISMQFFVRDDTVQMMVYMRSSDVWLGLPYDMFNFSMVALKISNLLTHNLNRPIVIGKAKMFVGSQHLYESNRSDAEKITEPYIENRYMPYNFSWINNVRWILKARETGDLYEDSHM